MKKPNLPAIVQSNHVVQASYTLTLAEKRLILLALLHIENHPNQPAAKAGERLEITAADLMEHFGVDQTHAYNTLKTAAETLIKRIVTIYRPDPDKPKLTYTRTHWVSAIDYYEGEGKLGLWIAPRIMPYLTQLSGEFVKYRIEQVAPMTSVHAIRLYELLLQWEKAGERYIELAELKRIFQIESQYPAIKDLKSRVIDPAVKQINTYTDFTASYENRKAGRTVIGLDFTFGPKPTEQVTKATNKPAAKTSTKSPTTRPKAALVPRTKRTPEQQAKAETALAEAKRGLR